jgi:hypothetical protein
LIIYLDNTHQTGARNWAWLRNLFIWKKWFNAVNYYYGSEQTIMGLKKNRRTVFVAIGNITNMGLISGFGFHGGEYGHLNIAYLLPAILFRVPLLREVLLWSGAVSDRFFETDGQFGAILDVVGSGRSCCFALNRMEEYPGEKAEKEYTLPDTFYEFAKREKIQVVPVSISHEVSRYHYFTNPLQRFFLETVGYPFPLFFIPAIFGEDPPKKVEIHMGVPMTPSEYSDLEGFSRAFFGQISGV